MLFYFYKWYIEPTKPLSRLPYCARELLFAPLSELDDDDGAISGIFTSGFIDTHHFGYAYGVLSFHEDGTVFSYTASEVFLKKIVRAHQLANWMEWYKTPSLSINDIPVFAIPDGRTSWDIQMGFFVQPPYEGTYKIEQGNLVINWNKEQKWHDDPFYKLWVGTLVNKQLNITKFNSYGTHEETYDFLNYNTCPFNND